MLDGIRVLDVTDERGGLASMILAGLGADVVAVEPPDGNPARRLAPFAGDDPGANRSLVHWAANRGKRSAVLDLGGSEEDRDRFRRLVAAADVLFETRVPGLLDDPGLGLGVDDLAALNPTLVHVTMSGFGSTGPRSSWRAPDLVALAAGGQLLLSGDADRAPLRCSVPQAWAHACGDAADAALIALFERLGSGRGQHCDISAQQSVMQATQSLVLNHVFGAQLGARVGGGMRLGPLDIRLVWPCLDGTVSITFLFGASAGPFSQRLFHWIWEEGGCDEATRDLDWVMFGSMMQDGEVPLSEFDRLKGLLADFCMTKTKQELFEAALSRKLLIAPAATIADVFETPHFVERDYWDHVEEPVLGRTIRHPGPIVKPSTGRRPVLGRAPDLGAHTAEVLAEWDAAGPATPVPGPAAAPASDDGELRGPLSGLKVLDFMWSLAGPSITRVIADYGATVVRVESSVRIEMGRTLNPFWQDKTDPEGSGVFLNANAGKLGLCLDLNSPQGREVALDLARWADVVTESFSPTAMTRWGLDYEHLREVNPGIVMMSSSLAGHTGPLAPFAGFGNLAAAMAGFYHTTGWPDRTCVGPYGGYTDYLSPRFAIAALLAALQRRARTGEGCYLDFSQTEAAMWALGPAFAEFEANGRIWERAGNADRNQVPNVVAPTRGDDRWIAVTCEDDAQWATLANLAGRPDLAGLDVAERHARREEVEAAVSEWTATKDGHDLAAALQAAGVPAHALVDSVDLWNDPHLAHRGHWVWVDHDRFGSIPIEGTRFQLSRTPAPPLRAAPTLGQHAYEILTELLGYDADRIADLAASAALE
jgi:crotonobetainyl-CoA:carnitine CoA-transferase CaiB-like acyl-CoA transferase